MIGIVYHIRLKYFILRDNSKKKMNDIVQKGGGVVKFILSN